MSDSNWRFVDAENRVVARTLPNGTCESILFSALTGVTPDPYIAPPAPVPQSVSAFQAKAALLNAGLLDRVEAMMASQTAQALAKLAWREAVEFQRESPTILTLAVSLELTAEQLDDLFIAAAQVTA